MYSWSDHEAMNADSRVKVEEACPDEKVVDGQRSIERLDDHAHRKAGILEGAAKTAAHGEVILVLELMERHRYQGRKRTYEETDPANWVSSLP